MATNFESAESCEQKREGLVTCHALRWPSTNKSLFSSIPIPKLYGISALGSVYEYTPSSRSLTPLVSTLNQTLLPTMRLRKDGILIPWTLEPQGEARLKQVIRDINLKEMVAGLPGELGYFDTTSTEDLSESILKGHTVSLCLICTNFKYTLFMFDQL